MRTVPPLMCFSLVLPGGTDKVEGLRKASPTAGLIYDASSPAIRPIRRNSDAPFLDRAIDSGFAFAMAVSTDDGTLRPIHFRGRLPATFTRPLATRGDPVAAIPQTATLANPANVGH